MSWHSDAFVSRFCSQVEAAISEHLSDFQSVRLFCEDESRFGILPVAQRRITLLGVKPVAKVDYLSKRVCEKLILVNECYNTP